MPTVECPECGERFHVVLAEDSTEEEETSSPPQLTAELLSWEEAEPRDPYTASDKDFEAYRVRADIEINGDLVEHEFFSVPEDVEFGYWTHVVRAKTDAGRKSKDVFATDDGELYLKNRGVPWDSDKQWTYLSKSQLQRRSELAGLGDVIEDPDPDSEGRYALLLGVDDRPLVVDGEPNADVMTALAKSLLVMQSRENPLKE